MTKTISRHAIGQTSPNTTFQSNEIFHSKIYQQDSKGLEHFQRKETTVI